MDDAGLTPLLIDAKREYVGQLTDVLAPFVTNHMVNVYLAARKQTPNGPTLTFQRALRAIPVWNSNSVRQQTAAIENKYSFLGDLVAACFVAYVKILSSVKLHHQKPNIRLKLPTNDAFVHKVYIHAAREYYANPALVRADRLAKVAVVRGAVEASVRDMLPIEDILKAYLGNTVDEDNAMVPSEFVDDDVFGQTPRPDPAPTPQPDFPTAAPPPPPQQDLFEAADDDEGQVKHVSLGGQAPFASQHSQVHHDAPRHDPRDAPRDQDRHDRDARQDRQDDPRDAPRDARPPSLAPFPSERPRPLFLAEDDY